MKSIIREDDIEQAICTRLSLPEFGWKRIECDPSVAAQDDVSKTGRASSSECILPEVFRNALKRLNPWMGEEMIEGIVSDYRKDYTGTDMGHKECQVIYVKNLSFFCFYTHHQIIR